MSRLWSFALAFGLLASLASSASAQTEQELEEARATFAEGVELSGQERWEEAAARFRAVLEVRSTAQVQFNLGIALSHTSALSEAAETLQAAIDSGDLDRRNRRSAQRALSEIEPRLARLTLRLTGDEGGAEILLDGESVGLDRIGQPIAVDPGDHSIVVQRGGAPTDRRTVRLAEGEAQEVNLVARAGGVLDPELLQSDEEEEASGGGSNAWLWAVVGGAAALVVVGVIIGIVVATSGGTQEPFNGNLSPGFLEVMP